MNNEIKDILKVAGMALLICVGILVILFLAFYLAGMR